MADFKLPRVYPIINIDSVSGSVSSKPSVEAPLLQVERYLRAGAKILQLRNKSLSDELFAELARKVIVLRNTLRWEIGYCPILINDSVEVCLASAADGVHLGQEDQHPISARKILGDSAIIGLSTHSLEEAQCAPREVLQYLALGPIFPSSTKSGHAPEVGLTGIRQWKASIDFPLVCIGGISKENAPEVFHSGADSIALISALEKDLSLIRELEASPPSH